MQIEFHDVKWNADDPEDIKDLPTTFKANIFDIIPEDEFSEILSDYISDKYGFCHEGFEYDFIAEKET